MALLAVPVSAVLFSPIQYLLRATISLLSPPIYLLAFISHWLAVLLHSPFTLVVSAETLYIFTGTAALVGAIVGSVAALTAYILIRLLDLEDGPPAISSSKPRQQLFQSVAEPSSLSSIERQTSPSPVLPHKLSSSGRRFPGISTILEEEDEDSSWSFEKAVRSRRMKKIGEDARKSLEGDSSGSSTSS